MQMPRAGDMSAGYASQDRARADVATTQKTKCFFLTDFRFRRIGNAVEKGKQFLLDSAQ